MKIYTKTGDDGTTGLFNGERVEKFNGRVQAYGTVDELNSIVGIVISHLNDTPIHPDKQPKYHLLKEHLTIVSHLLFNLGSDLATPLNPKPKHRVPRIKEENSLNLENWIDLYDESLEPLKKFILPGGSLPAAFLHQARTVCRRAERQIVKLAQETELNNLSIIFINRLSDYFFAAARFANFLSGKEDVKWEKDV